MSKLVYNRLKRLGRGMRRLVSGTSRLEALQLECRLEHILSGATCAPISLQDFETYLANQELSIENLQFAIWFMDYRARFMRLPLSIQQTSPDPAILRPWDVPPSSPLPVFEPRNSNSGSNAIRGWFDAVARRRQASSQTEDGRGGVSPVFSSTTRPAPATLPAFKTPRDLPLNSPPPGLSPSFLSKSTSSGVNLPTTPRTPDSGVPLLFTPTASASGALASPPFPLTPNSPGVQIQQYGISLSEQPFRDEALAVVATFMRAGGTGTKELAIDERLRKQVLEDLAYTTHPNIFAKVYQYAYHQLESSAHNFLALQSSNINIGKQLYWYTVGFVFTLIGFTISIVLIVFVPAYHHNQPFPIRRGARLAGMPFATAGACQLYNAYIGFCSEVFGRGSTQLKSWELDDPEEVGVEWRETGARSSSSALKKGSGPAGGSGNAEEAFELQDPPMSKKKKQDLEAIVPFDLDIVPSLSASSSGAGSRSNAVRLNDEDSSTAIILDPATFDSPGPTHEVAFVTPRAKSAKARYTRPPVFGPERVVLDERIRQYHLDVLHDTFMVAIWYCLIYTAVVLAIPGPKP
ncbi:hypothetical protein M407DRAFT_8655 [Tulasnella calospora MUT 4182]|uniref:RGS domain-containing protein n=1 Tax=Tulasnella calospora MUT 4182 TaxID=1051891 RepID=A0A0C3QH61_9AGAM|nr:hypothetical protein M407DRAFT_8655 [Tulasnella calospora MUT 4182]